MMRLKATPVPDRLQGVYGARALTAISTAGIPHLGKGNLGLGCRHD